MVCFFLVIKVQRRLVWFGGALACLPKEVEPRAILPLGPLHTHPVRWYPGSSYAAVGGVHQSDRNHTLDVSTYLRVGLFPLGGQATGYPFQGSRRLHPRQPVQRCDKWGEVPTLLEASLQIHLISPVSASCRHFPGSFFLCVRALVLTTRMS